MHVSAKVLCGIWRSQLQNLKRLAGLPGSNAWQVWILYGCFWRSLLVILLKVDWHRFGRGFLRELTLGFPANVWRTALIFLLVLAVCGLPEPSLLRLWTVPVRLNFSLILQMVHGHGTQDWGNVMRNRCLTSINYKGFCTKIYLCNKSTLLLTELNSRHFEL